MSLLPMFRLLARALLAPAYTRCQDMSFRFTLLMIRLLFPPPPLRHDAAEMMPLFHATMLLLLFALILRHALMRRHAAAPLPLLRPRVLDAPFYVYALPRHASPLMPLP